MAITTNDLKLMQAERNTDNDDGGGMMTGTALISGDINNLWDDVDSTEQARGGVSIRRVFPAVRTTNTDKLLGARVAITEDAAASNISTLLYQTGDHYAERAQIQSEIESYVVIGTQSPLRPVGTQREGQNAVVVYADKATDAPGVGEVLVLEDTDSGERQFVKITDVDVTSETYSYSNNSNWLEYQAYQVLLSISQPLNRDFDGYDPEPGVSHPTKILTTQSSNSAKYYGLSDLAVAATSGATTIEVESIHQSIVPTATTEVAMVDQTPGVTTTVIQQAGDSQSRSLGTFNNSVTLTLPTGWVPGSLSLDIGGTQYVDRGESLHLISGTSKLSSSTVDAARGLIVITLTTSSAITATYTPGVAVALTPYTLGLEITASNRQLTYTDNLQPAPARGSLRIEYQYLGEWYSLADDGTGTLSGDGGASGSVNFDTGSLSYILAGEPDQGTTIIYTWGAVPSESQITDAPVPVFVIELEADHDVGSTQIAWQRSTTTYTITEQTDGTWTGDGSAETVGDTVYLTPSAVPTSAISVSYDAADPAVDPAYGFNALSEQQGTTITLQTEPGCIPASVQFQLVGQWAQPVIVNGTPYDRVKTISLTFQGTAAGDLIWGSKTVGSIDAVTGEVTLNGSALQISTTLGVKTNRTWTQTPTVAVVTTVAQNINIQYRAGTVALLAGADSIAFDDLVLQIQTGASSLIPGALVFTVGGVELVDNGAGVLYRNWSVATAAGISCGQINYADATVELDFSQLGITNFNAEILSGAAGYAEGVVDSLIFRTASSPLRASGVQLLARRFEDTSLITAESDSSGVISGVFDSNDQQLTVTDEITGTESEVVAGTVAAGTATGTVEYQSGVVSVSFDQPVTIESLSYSAVAYTSVPLDPELIGLDPVKLPTNGQVPIFKPGYLALIHHTDTVEITTPTAGQVIDCGRTDLAVVRIKDAAGAELATDQYSVDKATGLVTLADPFSAVDADSNTLTLPLTLSHRVQDLCALSRVLVDGTLNLMTQLTHDYPLGSVCSAVVELGDLQARVEGLFSQKVDSGDFADELQGDASVAQYDDLNYPIQIDNLGAVQERWKIRWTDSSTFDLFGEQRGLVASGTRDADFSPINPMTSTPYFTLLAAGNGTGWVTGNIVRFDTVAAAEPVEAIRTTLPSHEKLSAQSVYIEFMGDAD